MNRPTPFPNCRRRPATTGGFTLVEMLVALVIGSFVFAAALSGIIALQRAYAATEQYATNLADQTRLLDCLGMDLRRARSVSFDADRQGMTITLPDFYNYNPLDTKRTAPLPNTPQIPDDLSRAVYTSTSGDPDNYAKLPIGGVYYRFDAATKIITREELPPADPTKRQAPTNLEPDTFNSVYGVRKLASSLQGFPEIQLRDDAGNPLGEPNTSTAGQVPLQASITVCFKPIFATVSTPDTNLIRLHGRVFLRNNDPGTN